jgi:hypothetical protein
VLDQLEQAQANHIADRDRIQAELDRLVINEGGSRRPGDPRRVETQLPGGNTRGSER